MNEINLGDTVILACDAGKEIPYNHMTVKQVNADGTVNLFRPYVHYSGVSYAGNNVGDEQVICYIGVETLECVDSRRLKLVEKSSKVIR